MKKLLKISVVTLTLLMLLGSFTGVFAESFSTFTYSIDGKAVSSPDAYTAEKVVKPSEMGIPSGGLGVVRDVFVDKENNDIYLVDETNNKVVVLDEFLKYRFEVSSFVNEEGIPDGLSGPYGVFVTNKKIYVADTGKNRIVVFDKEGNFIRTLKEPESEIFEADTVYKPIALAVDQSERIYVVSATTYMGIMVLDSDGQFQSFIGAQAVTASAIDLVWRQFQTAAQRAQSIQYVSTEFNNITIDDEGFIYVTTNSIDESSQLSAITSKLGTYAPVKKLNAAGNDIMARNGFFGPCGEVVTVAAVKEDPNATTQVIGGVSSVVDAAVGPEGTWSLIDQKRSRVYTYDDQGNLLFAFGEKGMKLGNVQTIAGIAYQGDKILVLDQADSSVTIYNRTEYGDLLISALHNNNQRMYDKAVEDWDTILQRNSNFDTAYVGKGKAYYRDAKWDDAMKYFKIAYDTKSYSGAFKMARQDWVSKWVLIVPIVVVAVIILVSKFLGYANKVNKKTSVTSGKRTYKQELLFVFHLMVHPFDGFWDLKHEKRGSVRAASTFIGITVLAFTYDAVGKAYLFNPTAKFSSIGVQVIAVLVPVLLWVTANWCLTTLMDGEGSFKDVYIAVGYAIAPLPIFMFLSTLLTNIATLDDSGFITLLLTLGWIWTALLIFFGMMITHDYSLGKNILTTLGTIIGMAFIMFVALLFSTLIAKMVGFIASLITEIGYRL